MQDPDRISFPPPGLFLAGLVTLLLSGAIFGFFYAWVCSTLWGLDRLEPDIAIAAMQAMNGVVRNAVFAPSFFLTPVACLATALLALRHGARRAAGLLLLGGLLYLVAAFLPTVLVNVPMNRALALVELPNARAGEIWHAYSGPWQAWNLVRTVASGAVLCLVGAALAVLSRARG